MDGSTNDPYLIRRDCRVKEQANKKLGEVVMTFKKVHKPVYSPPEEPNGLI